jgi:serine/threonine protein kinase
MYLMYMQYVPGGSLRDAMNALSATATQRRNGQRFLDSIAQRWDRSDTTASKNARNHSIKDLDWPSTVAWLGARMADGLDHAHRLGIRHRDIKPENVLLALDGQPLLADFNLGFAASIDGASPHKAFGGSLAYMSPEHLQVLLGEQSAEGVGERSDLFSLGTVLYELLFGHRPFEPDLKSTAGGWTYADHREARRRGPPVRDVLHDLPEPAVDVAAYIRECLAFSIDDRPQSASEVARRLQLLSMPRVQPLLSTSGNRWGTRWSARPLVWLLALGMLPSAILSPVNIWANHRIAIENFDHDFFHRIQEPIVNLIAFPLGIVGSWLVARQVLSSVKSPSASVGMEASLRSQVAHQSLKLPCKVAWIVVALWAGSGLVFPGWNQWASGSRVASMDFLGFFLSQLLHGLIAGCLSLVLLCTLVLNSFYPRLMAREAKQDEQQRLAELDHQLAWANVCLQLTPLLAILAIAISDQFDKLVFVALASIGFVGHLVASWLIPRLRAQVQVLRTALQPTETLLGRTS